MRLGWGLPQSSRNADSPNQRHRPNQTQMNPEIQLTQSGTAILTDGSAWLETDGFEWLEDWA